MSRKAAPQTAPSARPKTPARRGAKDGQGPYSKPLTRDRAGPLDLSDVTSMAGFMLRVVQVRVFQRYYDDEIGREVSPGVLSTLIVIATNPGVRPGALADTLVVRRPNMTKLLDSLTKSGHVLKRSSSGDGRSVALFITAKGRRLLERTASMSREHDEATTASLTGAERSELLRLLHKLAADLIDQSTWKQVVEAGAHGQ